MKSTDCHYVLLTNGAVMGHVYIWNGLYSHRIACTPNVYSFECNVSINPKPDHPPPPRQTPEEVFERANAPPLSTKKVRNPDPWSRKIVLKPHPRDNYFQNPAKKHKTWDRNYEKQYWNANMFRNIKTVKDIKAQSFLMGGFYGYSKYLKSFPIHL